MDADTLIQDAVRAAGYTELLDWAVDRAGVDIVALTEALDADVAPFLVELSMTRESHRLDRYAEHLRDMVGRLIVPGYGDRTTPQLDFGWSGLFDAELEDQAEELRRRVDDKLAAEPTWRPRDADDPALIELFEGVDLTRPPTASARARVFAASEEVLDGVGEPWSVAASLRALEALPPGHSRVTAVGWVNGQVLNGGFHQVHFNGYGPAIPLAVEGLELLGRPELAAVVARSGPVALGHRWGPLGRLLAGVRDALSGAGDLGERLDDEYVTLRRELPGDWLDLAIGELAVARPELFAPAPTP